MKNFNKIISLILVFAIVLGGNVLLTQAQSTFPSETNSFGTAFYIGETNQDEPFFDVVLPAIRENIAENNKHTVTPTYDAFPLANNPENFQGLGHTTYANINGKTVTAEAFYRVSNEGLNDPNCGMGLLFYQCIEYKRAHPEEDVKITYSSYRTSVTAAVCVIPESKYYGYMRSLYTTNYDEQGFVRISYLLTEAARMGIEVTLVHQLDSYAVAQYNPETGKNDKKPKILKHEKYFTDALQTNCYNTYAPGKKVSDYMNSVTVEWNVGDKTSDMQHVKSASVSHYLATDGTEHGATVFFESSNLDENNYRGANGNNNSQSGVIISDHDELYKTTYNYTQLMAKYSGLEDMFILRKLVNELNNEQIALFNAGRADEIPDDEQIVYIGGEEDPVFELYFTPFGGSADVWDTVSNPFCKYTSKLPESEDYIEFFWNEFGYGDCNIGNTLSSVLQKAFCDNPNPNNKYAVRVSDFDSGRIAGLEVGSEIGYCSIKSGAGIHAKDMQMSYVEDGVRHKVSLMTSCNFYMIAFNYRTNSLLVINETEESGGNFYEIFADRYSYGAINNKLYIDAPANIYLEVGETYNLDYYYSGSENLTWLTNRKYYATVKNGVVTAKGLGAATISVSDGTTKDTVKVEVVECKECAQSIGLKCNTDEQYVLSKKHSSMPKTLEAVIDVDKQLLTGTTTILGNDDGFETAIVFSINKSGNPRVAIRDKKWHLDENGKYIKDQAVYVFDKVNVATGKKVHLSFTIDTDNKKISCYVNGKVAQTGKLADIAPYEEKYNYIIGGDWLNGNQTHFPGYIKSVAVWSDVKTAEEISNDYKNGIDTADENLLEAYDFMKCKKHMTEDLSANDNDLEHVVLWQDLEDVEPVTDFEYSFAVIGDTQSLCEDDPKAMYNIYDWLLENKEDEKIEYVIGLGDITDDDTAIQWETAKEAISRLDGKLPYVLCRGNHDSKEGYNELVSGSYYQSNMAGTSVSGDYTNSYRYLNVQGTDYLIMTVDFAPSGATLAAINKVIEEHPDHRVIITTHAYMYRDGTTIDDDDLYPPTYYEDYADSQNGDDMWEKSFSQHDNVVMVLSGHDPWQHIVYRQDSGEKGNLVTQMLVDPQYVDRKYQSTGMVAMLYFSNDGNTLTVRYYSVEKDCYGSAKSQFTIDLINK
ncbi:MAG: metallophosphoesterase [Bacteroidaceae bacterium]|nr:metallophosphoesterase [Bacteroidaceae bacterium]